MISIPFQESWQTSRSFWNMSNQLLHYLLHNNCPEKQYRILLYLPWCCWCCRTWLNLLAWCTRDWTATLNFISILRETPYAQDQHLLWASQTREIYTVFSVCHYSYLAWWGHMYWIGQTYQIFFVELFSCFWKHYILNLGWWW